MTENEQRFTVVKRYYHDGGTTTWSYDIEEVTDTLEGFIGTYQECCDFRKQCEREDEREDALWNNY